MNCIIAFANRTEASKQSGIYVCLSVTQIGCVE